jgi:hypothetical protein
MLFAGVASIGVSLWFFGATAAAWCRLPVARAMYSDIDPVAAELVGDPAVIAGALAAMANWRIANHQRRPILSRVAHRLVQPVLPSQHEKERIARLQGVPVIRTD